MPHGQRSLAGDHKDLDRTERSGTQVETVSKAPWCLLPLPAEFHITVWGVSIVNAHNLEKVSSLYVYPQLSTGTLFILKFIFHFFKKCSNIMVNLFAYKFK